MNDMYPRFEYNDNVNDVDDNSNNNDDDIMVSFKNPTHLEEADNKLYGLFIEMNIDRIS